MAETRLDKALVLRGLVRSRTEAQSLIAASQVTVNGLLATKLSQLVSDEAPIAIIGERLRYVSRGGLKLEAALQAFSLDVTNYVALDVGASTGGFTDCLLQHEVRSVEAIDVGHNQMVTEIRENPKVRWREGINARFLLSTDFETLFDIIVVDLSFISLTLVLPALAPLLVPKGDLICLVKPQFEVGFGNLGKGGIVRDDALRASVIGRISDAAAVLGLSQQGQMTSPVIGGDGNIEFLLWLKNG